MTRSVLITQCLQNDFAQSIESHTPLPNKLHVGHDEALRLLGPDPERGPVAQLMKWARAQAPDALEIIHIRDWHDAEDPAQGAHLEAFGAHAVRGSAGARLVVELDEGVGERAAERYVDAVGLNDFEHTTLGPLLERVLEEAGGDVRVGVVGVWTEAKVSFLLYDLKTRCGIDQLATCSALTASASRAQHFNALDQLRKLLNVRVFDSVGDFGEWLLPEGQRLSGETFVQGYCPEISGAQLDEADQDLVAFLYRDSARVQLHPLGGGFSGAKVFSVTSHDAVGHEEAPTVAKVGERRVVGAERVAFERVQPILGNDAPAVLSFVDLGQRAGIKYAYAAMGQSDVSTFKALFESGESMNRIEAILRTVFEGVLGRFYAAAQYERVPLLEHYGFAARHADSVRRSVDAVGAGDTDDAAVLCRFYAEQLEEMGPSPGEYHFVSYVHGDLNGANILIDGRENVWLIDFFHTARRHVLQDLIKLENDLLYIFTPLADEADLAQAKLITDALGRVQDLQRELPVALPGLTAEPLRRAWAAVRILRSMGSKLCREDRDPVQVFIAGLRYSAHTLSFDESSPLQKRWALYAAARQVERITRVHRRDQRLRINWLDGSDLGSPGRLGLTLCPGRRDRGRRLKADLDVLVEAGTDQLVSVLTRGELEWAGVEELPAVARAHFGYRHLPIRDQSVPSLDDARELSAWICERIEAGQSVVVHCLGGLGRAGTIAACVLVDCGLAPEDAIAAIRRARGPRAIENRRQERFVYVYGGGSMSIPPPRRL